MVRVKYTDNTGCNDSVAEYSTEREAWNAIYEELEHTKKELDGREHRVLNSTDSVEIYTPGDDFDAGWTLEYDTEEYARQFCKAIKTLAEKPANLDNLESYLSKHFNEWLRKFASTPKNMVAEMKAFADMKI